MKSGVDLGQGSDETMVSAGTVENGEVKIDYVERYERLAEAFRKETGMIAPGKDIAPGFGGAGGTEDERWTEWLAFLARVLTRQRGEQAP